MRLRSLMIIASIGLLTSCKPSLKQETIQTYPDGSKKTVASYYGRMSNLHSVMVYFPNGKLQSEHYFTRGKPAWGAPPGNDILKALGVLANVFSDSVSSIYYEDGRPRSRVGYLKGKKNGTETSWYANGQIKSEGAYAEGIPQGRYVSCFEDGKPASEVSYIKGQKDGVESIYYPDGKKKQLITYQNGDRNGLLQEWFSNGNMKNEEHYTKNVLDGTYATYHDNGKKQEEGTYKMGRINGEKKAWNENGRLIATANYVDGEFESGQSY